MNRLDKKILTRSQRQARIRSKVIGTTARPRLTIFISNLHVSAQVIDDSKGKTLVASTTVGNKDAKGTLTEKATFIGADIAKKAKAAKIKTVAFDRNGRKYHGRIKALAEAARAEGLEF